MRPVLGATGGEGIASADTVRRHERVVVPRLPAPRAVPIVDYMLYLIGLVLLAAWVIGLAFKVTFAAFHLLLILAIAAIVWAYVRGRRSASATP